MIGRKVSWTPRPEWGERGPSTGTVRHAIRGADGLSYAVNVGNTVVYVHESRLIEGTK
ncbi:hypothetical protein SEA_PH8S_98 [Mycobacterium phage Ph8s]|nr:hypothetical protein SEA_PH8S_98 [Mycobacterium phage Ph8s]